VESGLHRTVIAVVLATGGAACLSNHTGPTLPNRLDAAKNKGELFTLIRNGALPDEKWIANLSGVLDEDEVWLADTLRRYGPEPLWPLSEVKERIIRHLSIYVDSDIQTVLPYVDSDFPVRAYFFPGRTERRALILSGIHGDEGAGVLVAERLRTLLRDELKEENRPYFTTIIVPVVIPRTRVTNQRYVPGGLGLVQVRKNHHHDAQNEFDLVWHDIEPNLNYPLPGENYAMARRRGENKPTHAELVTRVRSASGRTQIRAPRGPFTSIRLLPETATLIQLIERFQPERLAVIHSHSRMSECHRCREGQESDCGGEGPGIFVDPRGLDPASGRMDNRQQLEEDKRLAALMISEAREALRRQGLPSTSNGEPAFPPLAGNDSCRTNQMLYYSPRRMEGNSLGDWAPVPAPGRPGIATVTIELPKYRDSEKRAERRVIQLHRDVLAEIFLGGVNKAETEKR